MSDPVDVPSAGQLAAFDQAHSVVSRSLDALVDGYRAEVADGKATREITIVGLAEYINAEMEPRAMAEHLAVAVDRLVHP